MATPNTSKARPAPKRTRKINVKATTPKAAQAEPAKKAPRAAINMAETPKAARPPKIHAHIEAGVSNTWEGESSFLNSNVPARVRLVPTRDDITTRMSQALYSLRKRYGKGSFVARGIDNGVLSHLEAAQLIRLSGGRSETENGVTYRKDGEQKLTVTITAKGQSFGRT